jgi:hypothetical protein
MFLSLVQQARSGVKVDAYPLEVAGNALKDLLYFRPFCID